MQSNEQLKRSGIDFLAAVFHRNISEDEKVKILMSLGDGKNESNANSSNDDGKKF